VRVSVAATPSVALPTLDWLITSPHELVSVITRPDKPAGRGQKILESPVATWATQHGIACHKPESTDEIAILLEDIEVLITIGFGVILPKRLLQIPEKGCINLHFSLLPRWRGAAPVQRSIEAGDLVTGVCVFQLDEGMDTGPIYISKRFALDGDITSDELFAELAAIGPEAICETLEAIEKGILPIPQESEGATRAEKITREDAHIQWAQPATKVSQQIRAFTSSPGAWSSFRTSTIKILKVAHSSQHFPAGEIWVEQKRLYIGTTTTALEVLSLQPAGKVQMSAAEWLNGVRLQSGEIFG